MNDGNSNNTNEKPTPDSSSQTLSTEAILKEIDTYLDEADPQFIKSLTEIKVENSDINLSILDEAFDFDTLEKQALPTPKMNMKEKIFQIFDVKSNLKIVLLFWFSVFLISGVVYVAFHSELWDRKDSLFLTSFSALGAPVEDFDPATDMQYFFDNPRFSKNLVSLKKMLVNLKKLNSTHDSSMLAFEISIEGITQEVVVEIKDRESEFTDRALRIAEDFSYEDLVTKQGKQKLTEKILEAFNANLTKGKIRRVMYASFIIKG